MKGKFWVSPVRDGEGFYANTRLDNGWWVQHWGETEEEALANLKDYIQSGRFEEDRGR